MGAAPAALVDLYEASKGDPSPDYVLVLDCHSRARLLEDEFLEELGLIERGVNGGSWGVVSEGAQVAGEIASDGERLPEFHDKTLAVDAVWVQR